MFAQLPVQEIESLLHNQLIGRIGCSTGNITYVVPTTYAYDGIHIYGHTQEGMKIRMMRANPMVCFEVDAVHSDMSKWQSVICWGEFEEVTDIEERSKAIEVLLNRHLPLLPSKTMQLSPQWPFHPADLNSIGGIVYRIKIHEKTGRCES